MIIKKEKKALFIIIAIVALAAIAGVCTYQILWHNSEEESNSSITKVDSEDDSEKGSVDASLRYAGYVTFLSDEKLVTLNFTNPSKSRKSLNLEIIANVDGEDIVLAKSDKVHPGYKIDSVKCNLDREIPKGNYKGKFIVHFYNEQDKEEIVNSEIAIDVYVK